MIYRISVCAAICSKSKLIDNVDSVCNVFFPVGAVKAYDIMYDYNSHVY